MFAGFAKKGSKELGADVAYPTLPGKVQRHK
jgi:hypothetical protein